MMLKKSLALSVCAALLLASSPVLASEEKEGEVASLGELILKEAKSKFVSTVGGQIGSLFASALFGSSGPSYVNLTEESLQAIQDRVRIELVDAAEYEYIAALESLELSMQYYSDTAQNNNPDISVLGSILVNSNDIITHYSLNNNFNDEYYYLADSFALAASLSVAIYVERNLQEFISDDSVTAQANQLANRLQSLLEAKKDADLPLTEQCEDKSEAQYEHIKCELKDPHGNTHSKASIYDSNARLEERWEIKKELTRRNYYSDRFSNIENVIYKLRNF
jgi:hypothetical protein